MKKVKHYSIIIKLDNGTILTTTLCGLCGRMDNGLADGWNIAEKIKDVSCKHCLKAMKTVWGKSLIEQSLIKHKGRQ